MWSVYHWDDQHGLVEDAIAHDEDLAQSCLDDYVEHGLIPGCAFIVPRWRPHDGSDGS